TDAAVGARIRRLSLEALIAAAAVDVNVLGAAAHDPDAQVRRLAMRAASPQAAAGVGADEAHAVLSTGRADDSPSVRIEALRVLRARTDSDACPAAVQAVAARDVTVALVAIELLAACGTQPEALAALEHAAEDLPAAGAERAWHRAAHAIVALASAAPDRAASALAQCAGSRIWQLRMYAARAAA